MLTMPELKVYVQSLAEGKDIKKLDDYFNALSYYPTSFQNS